jgi:esterase/lipase superfamily enzyme
MKREYHKWFSPNLSRDMELLIFGQSGANVIVFPTRVGRFYDYENWKIVDALRPKIEEGHLRLICLDSVDEESLYCNWKRSEDRIKRHIQYENYILEEVIPLIFQTNHNHTLISHGCSLGAYHAMNLACRHPKLFCKVVSLSGRYDLTKQMNSHRDLFDEFYNEDIYFNTPSHFLSNLNDESVIANLKKMEFVFAIGKEDAFYENNIHFKEILEKLGLNYSFYTWEGEAHKAKYWANMVRIYL